MKLRYLYVFLHFSWLLYATESVSSQSFDNSSDQQKLEQKTIIAAGNVTARLHALPGESLTLSARRDVTYEIGRHCFSSIENASGKAGFLVIDQIGEVTLGILSASGSSIKIGAYPVTLLDCLAVSQRNFDNSLRDKKRFMEQMDMQQKKNEMMLELLKKQERQLKRVQ